MMTILRRAALFILPTLGVAAAFCLLGAIFHAAGFAVSWRLFWASGALLALAITIAVWMGNSD